MNTDEFKLIRQYFPELDDRKLELFRQMGELYTYWNDRINLISRNDIAHFYERHVLHSLAIAKAIDFPVGIRVMDMGTGGGFPGIPLAIMFPGVSFTLVDSTRKKIGVVEEVAAALKLDNIRPVWSRAEDLKEKFAFVVSRAVTSLDKFVPAVKSGIQRGTNAGRRNGIFYLRGDIDHAFISQYRGSTIYELSDWFEEPFYSTKKLVYIPLG